MNEHLDHELWSLENNILTPTLKLKRPECLQRYQKEVDEMYAHLETLDAQATKQQK
jgi:long-chain acyl-CoA synthetase